MHAGLGSSYDNIRHRKETSIEASFMGVGEDKIIFFSL
jgi:hypothetical protein